MLSQLFSLWSRHLLVLGLVCVIFGGGPLARQATPTSASPVAVSAVGRTVDSVRSSGPSHPGTMTVILDLSFVDRQHGWVLGISSCQSRSCLVLRQTNDSGRTWQALPDLPGVYLVAPEMLYYHVWRFVNASDGVGSFALAPGLFATHDGGHTWQHVWHQGVIVALASLGASIWALEETCARFADLFGACPLRLLRSRDNGRTWSPETRTLPIEGIISLSGMQLVRQTSQDAWLLAGALLATHDGGRTWRQLSSPCLSGRAVVASRLAALSHGRLWLLCEGQPATDMAAKMLYWSSDGGQHWSLVASTCFPLTSGIRLSHCGRIPSVGVAADLVITSSQRGWLALLRSTLYSTHDGGQTWEVAIPNALGRVFKMGWAG